MTFLNFLATLEVSWRVAKSASLAKKTGQENKDFIGEIRSKFFQPRFSQETV